MNAYSVYIHKLIKDGRVYVGQTKNVSERWACSGVRYKTCTHMWSAIQKYGWNAFEHTVVASGLTPDEANELEERLIEKYDSINNGFNLRPGGNNSSPTAETRRKMSEAQSGEKHPMYGKHIPDETRKKISEALSGEKNHFYGRRHSEDTLNKIRAARARQIHPLLGKNHTDSAKRNMRDAKIDKTKTVVCVESGETYIGIKEASRKTGVDKSSISRCCRGLQGKAGGFHWKFSE